MGPRSRIAVVVKGYPRLSETFIAQEILGLERCGLQLVIFSLRHPTDPTVHDVHHKIRSPVLYLPEYLHRERRRVLRAWQKVRRWPSYRAARRLWLDDLRRDRTTHRGRRFGQALVLAAELPADIGLIYAHYLHTPASVARYAAKLARLDWCGSAHAKDIWTTPDWELREKLLDCRWLTTCTAAALAHLHGLAPKSDLFLTRHGLDPDSFPPPDRGLGPDGREPDRPVRLLGVSRLVPKKGIDVLLDALAALPANLHWRYDHIGDGPLLRPLKEQSARLGLESRIDWRGARPRDQVLEAYRAADLFVLASRIAPDGDRDGLPNVLLEAGAMELPVVASRVSAIPELVGDGVNGRLVEPEDPAALAGALVELIRAPALRARLGRAGRRRVLADFSMEPGLDHLAARLRAGLDQASAAAA